MRAPFRAYGGLNAIPVVLDAKHPDEIIETSVRLRPTFGAVNLQDISAPRGFDIERQLVETPDCRCCTTTSTVRRSASWRR